jgi:hypothetical protein
VNFVVLAALAFIDGTLCGFRAAAGRNPRIFLRRYYLRAMTRGAIAVTVWLAIVLAVALSLRAVDATVWPAFAACATTMGWCYGAFATIVVLALALYASGNFDLGVLASVLALGPLTLIRPLVIGVGAGWAAIHADHLAAAGLAVVTGLVMANFERVLDLGHPPWRGLEGDRRAAGRGYGPSTPASTAL